ncbi:hypothetical protein RUM44_005569 [Polyplax serrata]|uniref:Ig-like domain-containing protein n=1 Tax=Polyplax serrata TaxID=468196 RepID=A0ABR1ADR8_POLSC
MGYNKSKGAFFIPFINLNFLISIYYYDILFLLTGDHKKVAWIKADTKAILAIHEHVITNNARLSVTHNDYNTWTLNIRGVRREDRGQYMCQVNTDPMKSQTAFLEVVIPPDIIYEETSGDLMVPEGGSAKLVCKARGHPKPKVIWRREDGGDIIVRGGTATKTRMSSVEGEMLTLSKVTRSEMGAYLCIAANGVPPSVSKRMMLHVHYSSSKYPLNEFNSVHDVHLVNSILIFVDVRENVFCELKLEKTITIKKSNISQCDFKPYLNLFLI